MVGKVQKVESVNKKVIAKQPVKNEQIKRKQTSSVIFVKVFKFQENIFKIAKKNFYKIIKKISWKTHRSR